MFGFGEDETDDIKRWRQRAEELRARAGVTANAASHDVYENLADTYERLARKAEERAGRRRKPAAPATGGTPPPPPRPSRSPTQLPQRAPGSHRFKVGETVSAGAPTGSLIAAPELLRIIHLVPTESGEHQYWVKSIANGTERMAPEGQLHPVA